MQLPAIFNNRIITYPLSTVLAVIFGLFAFEWYIGLVIFIGLVISWAIYQRNEIVYLILLTLFIWGRVILHPIVMTFYVNPSLIEAVVIVVLLILVVRWRYFSIRRKYDGGNRGNIPRMPILRAMVAASTGLFVLVIPLMIIFGTFGFVYSQEQLASELTAGEIDTLPDLDTSQIRLLPKMVGERYIVDAAQYSRLTPWDTHLVLINDTPQWVSILSPDGFINSIVMNAGGIVGVDATVLEKNSFVVEQELTVAPGRFFTSEPWYKAIEHDYWADYEYEYPVIYEGEIFLIVPKITYTFEFKFPSFYTVPHWDGLLLIDGDGGITELTPEEAALEPILAGQRLFPEYLSRAYIDALNYEQGAMNVFFFHDEQFEIIDVSEQGNNQPFLIKTDDSLEWIFACKPYGETTQGIFKVFLLDARTGNIEFLRLPATDPLLGPVASVEYVMKELPLVDWWSMQAVEPIPVVIENDLFWEVRIVPYSGAGVAYITAVDSKSGDVYVFETADGFRDFVMGLGGDTVVEPSDDIETIISELRDLIAELEDRLNELESLYSSES